MRRKSRTLTELELETCTARRVYEALLERRPVELAAALLLTVTSLSAGCASTDLRPGTGDLSFRLTWTGSADLDLYVRSPLGERIYFLDRQAPSGGKLDVDCNVRGRLCPEPMENIYWARGAAPTGTYEYWVIIAQQEGMTEDDSYRVEVRRTKRVVQANEGSVQQLASEIFSSEIIFAPKQR